MPRSIAANSYAARKTIGRGLPERKGAFDDVRRSEPWFNSQRNGVRFNTDECFETARFQAVSVRVYHAVKRTPQSVSSSQ